MKFKLEDWLNQYKKAVSTVQCGMKEVELLTGYKVSVNVE